MFTRIVKMEFKPREVAAFLANFERVKHNIRAFSGCQHLELWQDKQNENVFFTYSHWDKPESLEAYRNSELFREVWSSTKTLFNARPEAWSVDTLHRLS